MFKQLLALSITLAAPLAFADHKEGHESGPCKKIVDACKAAGFEKGKHKEGKGLWMDCMHSVMEGKAVEGVHASSEDVAACKAKKAEHHEKHK